MMIKFQRQIETVGSHHPFISRVADRVQRRCSHIRFHRRRGCVSRQRETRLQTDRHCKRRPRHVHSAFRNNDILGGWGDPDRYCGIIHFHPLAQTAPRRLLASLCWQLKLSGYPKCTFSIQPPLSGTKDWTKVEGRFSSGCCWSEANFMSSHSSLVKLATECSHQPTKRKGKKKIEPQPKFACFCTSHHIAVEWFLFK